MYDPLNLLRLTLESVRDGVVTTDAAGHVLNINAAAQAMTGWSSFDAVGKPVETIINLRAFSSDLPVLSPVYAVLRDGIKRGPSRHALLVGRDGRRVGVQSFAVLLQNTEGITEGCLLVFYDVSEAERIAERMSYLSQQDPLTGLPNRLLLVDRLEQATRLSDRTRESLAVLLLDLDHFHQINESFGRSGGDQLLKEMAYRISDALRESDTVCRLGGDEFVILLQGVHSINSVESLADKLLLEMARPSTIGGAAVSSGCSIGVSLYPGDATDAETLMRLADGAMHAAKRAGRGRCVFVNGEPSSIGSILAADESAEEA